MNDKRVVDLADKLAEVWLNQAIKMIKFKTLVGNSAEIKGIAYAHKVKKLIVVLDSKTRR